MESKVAYILSGNFSKTAGLGTYVGKQVGKGLNAIGKSMKLPSARLRTLDTTGKGKLMTSIYEKLHRVGSEGLKSGNNLKNFGKRVMTEDALASRIGRGTLGGVGAVSGGLASIIALKRREKLRQQEEQGNMF